MNRRRLLQAGSSVALGAVAGCLGFGDSPGDTDDALESLPEPGPWQQTLPAELVVTEPNAEVLYLDAQQTASAFPSLYEDAGFAGIAGQFGVEESEFGRFIGLRTPTERLLTVITGTFTQSAVVETYSESGEEPARSEQGYEIYERSLGPGVAVGEGTILTGSELAVGLDVATGETPYLGQERDGWTRLLGYPQQGVIGIASPRVSGLDVDLSVQPTRIVQAATAGEESGQAALAIALQYEDGDQAGRAVEENRDTFADIFSGEDEELTGVDTRGREVVLSGRGSTEQALG